MIVCTVGTFDLLHVGHLALLEYCSTLGDVVAVGIASDQVVNSFKPNVPVISLDQRQEILKALRCVDIVRRYHELEYVSSCKRAECRHFCYWPRIGTASRIMWRLNPIWHCMVRRSFKFSTICALCRVKSRSIQLHSRANLHALNKPHKITLQAQRKRQVHAFRVLAD